MSRIEQLIGEIEEYIDSCKFQALSNSKIIVNKEEMEELLVELRMRIPDAVSYTHLDVYKRQVPEMAAKSSIFAALQLYLDFINLFVYLLRFVGRKKYK